MPRRLALSEQGRIRIRGKRVFDTRSERPRNLGTLRDEPRYAQVTLPNGDTLNIPESRIYYALVDMKYEFVPQKIIGGGRRLGGGFIDFYLPKERVAIEFQGPFHSTDLGVVKDSLRRATRMKFLGAGGRVVEIFDADLDRIHEVLRKRVGRSHRTRRETRSE